MAPPAHSCGFIYTRGRRLASAACPVTCSLTFFISSWQEYMDANKCINELLKQLEEERRNVRR